MNRTMRAVVSTSYWVALTILALNALLVFFSLRTINRNNEKVDHTRQVTFELQRTLSILKDAETGQRGFLLTGQPAYLEPYRAAVADRAEALGRLQSLTLDNQSQQARTAELKRLADEKMAELQQTITLQESGRQEAALKIVNSGDGRRLMDLARQVVDEMETEEKRLLDDRTAASRLAGRNALASLGVTTGIGLLLLLLASCFDRHAAAAKLRAAEVISEERAWLSTTLRSIGDAVIATDSEGRVKYMNPIAETLTAWGQTEAAGRPLGDVFNIINEHTRLPVEHPVERVIREGIIVGLANHTVLIARNGSETAIEDSAAPIRDGRGIIIGVVMVFRDASEQRRHEAETKAAKEEAEEANRAKDRFLAVLSHELRTPLNPILLAVSSMLERPTPPEEVVPNLEMVRQNVNLQARLIDDLLDVMRIVRGKMPLHWEIADCHTIIKQAIDICRSEILGKGLHLDFELNAEQHYLNVDPVRLQQLFWNLIKNAVKFTPDGGKITVHTRNQGDADGAADQLVIEVSDTGIGIEPDVLPVIFEPFQQGELTITRRFGGMGLGLAICKGIVEGHGGTLTAESQGRGKGTTFRIELRTLRTPETKGDGQPTESSPADQGNSSCRILVVEDEPATRKLMARLLRGLGHEVTSTGTIAEALMAIQANEIDMIISDIGLPDGSGLELMREVVARRGPVPSIALTGYGMEEDIRRSHEAGFTAHMTKPIDFAKLDGMIRHVALGIGSK